jgi:SOS-response transcriptional repressor LexA
MMRWIHDGNILVVDCSQIDPAKLNGQLVIAWHQDMGLTVPLLRRYDHTDALQPEIRERESIALNGENKWRIVTKVLWWIRKAP